MITTIKSGKISKDVTRMSKTNVYKTSAEKSGHLETDGMILVYLNTCSRLMVRFNVSHPDVFICIYIYVYIKYNVSVKNTTGLLRKMTF